MTVETCNELLANCCHETANRPPDVIASHEKKNRKCESYQNSLTNKLVFFFNINPFLLLQITYSGGKSYKDDKGVYQKVEYSKNIKVFSTSYRLTNLIPFVKYQLEVAVKTSAGTGQSKAVSFTTFRAGM